MLFLLCKKALQKLHGFVTTFQFQPSYLAETKSIYASFQDYFVTKVKENSKKIRALVLMSGGLDSSLAAKMLLDQGVEVIGIYFYTGFCITAQKSKTGRRENKKSDVVKVAEKMNIQLEIIDVSKDYVPMVSKPKFGYGKNMNPCIDCRIFMLKETKKLLEFFDAQFIATGEVIGQRPKSQHKQTQFLIAKEADAEGLLLRPLSAKLLPPTLAETNGWVKRELLGDLQGRSRKPQMQMASDWDITDASSPAGGCCFLADETYSLRFKDLVNDRIDLLDLEHAEPLSQDDVILLGVGRHIKVRKGLRVICGRDQGENSLLQYYKKNRISIEAHESIPGPSSVLDIVDVASLETNLESWSEVNLEIADTVKEKLKTFIEKSKQKITIVELWLCTCIMANYMKDSVEKKLVLCCYDSTGKAIVSLELTVENKISRELLKRNSLSVN